MTAATMFVYHYGFDMDELIFTCGSECVNPESGSLFEDSRVFIFKDGSSLKISDGVVWTAGRKGIWRPHALD